MVAGTRKLSTNFHSGCAKNYCMKLPLPSTLDNRMLIESRYKHFQGLFPKRYVLHFSKPPNFPVARAYNWKHTKCTCLRCGYPRTGGKAWIRKGFFFCKIQMSLPFRKGMPVFCPTWHVMFTKRCHTFVPHWAPE